MSRQPQSIGRLSAFLELDEVMDSTDRPIAAEDAAVEAARAIRAENRRNKNAAASAAETHAAARRRRNKAARIARRASR